MNIPDTNQQQQSSQLEENHDKEGDSDEEEHIVVSISSRKFDQKSNQLLWRAKWSDGILSSYN